MNIEEAIDIIHDHVPYFDEDVERVIAKLRAAEELAKTVREWGEPRTYYYEAMKAYKRAGGEG